MASENEIALKPCPFCGGRAELVDGITNDFRLKYHRAACMVCGAGTRFFEGRKNDDPKSDAAEAWNRRADDGKQEA